jgi:hypothetical protein
MPLGSDGGPSCSSESVDAAAYGCASGRAVRMAAEAQPRDPTFSEATSPVRSIPTDRPVNSKKPVSRGRRTSRIRRQAYDALGR